MGVVSTTSAESRSRRGRREAGSPGRGAARLVLGLSIVGPGLVFLIYQQLDYILVPYVCAGVRSPAWFHVLAFIAVLMLAALAALGVRDWRRSGGDLEMEEGTYPAAARFVSIMGASFAAFLALAVLAMWVAHLVLHPCQ